MNGLQKVAGSAIYMSEGPIPYKTRYVDADFAGLVMVRVDNAKLYDVQGLIGGIAVSAQSIANPQNHACRDITLKDIVSTHLDQPDAANRYMVYVQCAYANWLVDGLNAKYLFGGGAINNGSSLIRANGQRYGNSTFRNISCARAGWVLYTEQGGADGTELAVGLSCVENVHLGAGSGIVLGCGIKHLASTNRTMGTAAGTAIKSFATVNGIANVTNESIGVHAVVS